MDNVLELKRRNEEIAEKFGVIGAKLAAADNPAALFETWLAGMAEAFGIPFLWMSLIYHPGNLPLIKALRLSAILKDRLNIVEESTFLALVPNGPAPVLVNGEALRPFFRLLPKNKYFIRSLAVAPLVAEGRIMGSLNHGDSSPGRYDPKMDAGLLQSLATRLSARLAEMAAP